MSWWSQLNPLLRFGLKFCLLFGLCDALSVASWSDKPLSVFLSAYAHVSNRVLVVFGQNSHVTGSTIQGSVVSLTIERGCDALDPILVLCAGVLAYPASWRCKAVGLALGVPAIMFLNVVRILSLYAIQLKAPALFNPVHLDIWPVVFVILAGLLWISWIRWVLKSESRCHAAA
jgi:exosortase H (IPTLxxWG-CTERM-specific)